MNTTQTISLMKRVTNAYPNLVLTADMMLDYSDMLEDMPFDLALKNVNEHIKTSRFAPTIAEIRGGYTDAHERQKRETQEYIRQQQERKPIPVPPEIKAKMDKLFERERAE